MLHSRYPMLIWRGPQLIQLYNDAYTPVLGLRHPSGLGQPAAECWSEAWPTVGPLADAVMKEGASTWSERLQIVMTRNGWPEEVYMTFSYSPITDESGGIGGLFCACTEETQRVLGERRLRCLRALGEEAGAAATAAAACEKAADVLDSDRFDLPFTLIYLNETGGLPAKVAGSRRDLAFDDAKMGPIFSQVTRKAASVEIDLVASGLGPVPSEVWPEAVTRALVLPMSKPGKDELAGFVVAGISPRLNLDDGYVTFLDLVARQVAASIAGARAYEEERRRAEMLAEIDRAKTLFFSNVSHEFRTPLTLMLGPLEEMLARNNPSDDGRELLTVAHRNALRLLKLVNTLLDFSRVEAGRAQARFEPVDLAAYTAELASNFRSACERAGLKLEIDCAALPKPVPIDREMWEKIVLNLLSNAFKFTYEGTIAVNLSALDQEVELNVTDTGVGIPEEEIPHVFERFHRVEKTRGRSHEGTGIGLALVQELVRLHGGTIDVESVLAQGSTFSVRIPLTRPNVTSRQSHPAPQLASTEVKAELYVEEALRWLPGSLTNGNEHFRRSLGRVLVVDDNADMREYVRRLMADDYEVVTATNGEEGLQLALATSPDVVLADIMMPVLDGFGLLQALRSAPETSTIPVILLSARAGEEARSEGMDAGADDYLVKPFSARELLARVGAHLRLARARKEAESARRAGDERLRRAISIETVGVIFFDLDGAIRDANDAFLRISGYSRDEVRNGEIRWEHLNLPELNPNSAPYEKECVRPDGTRWWGLFAGRKITEEEFVEFVVDITERKRAETSLREREAWLGFQREALETALDGQPIEVSLATLVRAVVERLGMDIRAAFYITSPDGTTLHHVTGMSPEYATAVDGFKISPESLACGLATHTGRPVITRDVRDEPLWAPWLWMAEKFQYRGCWSFPIHTTAGKYVGSLAIYSLVPREPLPSELEFVDLASQTAAIIIGRHSDAQVRQRAEAALREKSGQLQQSLTEKEELLKEVHHRVKNNLQVIVSLLNRQGNQLQSEGVAALFQETRNRVLAISAIHEQLYQEESPATVSLVDYARRLVPGLVAFYGLADRVQVEVAGDGIALELERAVPYGMLLNELVSNACKHAFPHPTAGRLAVTILPNNGTIQLTVADTGKGLPDGFAYKNTSGLGMKLVDSLVRQLRGRLEIRSHSGTIVKVSFPSAGNGSGQEKAASE
jgi:PAS domain S-box-containing protein